MVDSEVRKGRGEKRVLGNHRTTVPPQDQQVVQGSFLAPLCFKSGRCDSGMALSIAHALHFQPLSQWGTAFSVKPMSDELERPTCHDALGRLNICQGKTLGK